MKTKVEVTENYIRIPNPKHKDCDSDNLRTIAISSKEGIKALYCLDHKKIKTYLFDKEEWSLDEAKDWVEENAKDFKFLENQYAKGYIKKAEGKDEEEEGVLPLCIISSETVDRHGDVLKADGWSFNNFMKNPVLQWAHNATMGERRPAIGKVSNVEVRDGKVYFTPKFDMKDPFAKEVYRKYKEGFLNAFSIGFLPTEWEEKDNGYEFKEQEALEFSCVNVPANPEAVVVLRSSETGVSKDWNEWRKDEPKEDEDMEEGGLADENPKEPSEEDEDYPEDENWKSDFGKVKEKLVSLYKEGKADTDEYKEVSELYKGFGRIPPEEKHFNLAVFKVARGKKIKRKIKTKKKNKLLGVLKEMAKEVEEDKSDDKEVSEKKVIEVLSRLVEEASE